MQSSPVLHALGKGLLCARGCLHLELLISSGVSIFAHHRGHRTSQLLCLYTPPGKQSKAAEPRVASDHKLLKLDREMESEVAVNHSVTRTFNVWPDLPSVLTWHNISLRGHQTDIIYANIM